LRAGGTGTGRRRCLVVGLSVTAEPAANGLRPLTLLPGTLNRYGSPRWRLDGFRREVVEQTARALRERGRDDPIHITGPQLVEGMRIDQLGTAEQLQALEEAALPAGELWRRVVRTRGREPPRPR
jgi:hypothetical protein